MKEFYEWFEKMYPLFMEGKLSKAETEIKLANISAYWAGKVLRIDIRPK